ncbi:urease accessory UreF family protein [soil metagenome]
MLALLQLADGRLPAGGHAHSAGLERAVTDGRVHDDETLREFVRGRVGNVGLADAALAVVARRAAEPGVDWIGLDAEAAARTAALAQRGASRRLGRQLLRAGRVTWPDPVLDELAWVLPGGAMQPLALGAVARVAGIGDRDVAWVSLFATATTPAGAAVKLLGLDPLAVHRMVAELDEDLGGLVDEAMAAADRPLAALPAPSSFLVDVSADRHALQEGRLFAS